MASKDLLDDLDDEELARQRGDEHEATEEDARLLKEKNERAELEAAQAAKKVEDAAAEAAKTEETKKSKDDEIMIPKARFDKAVAAARAREEAARTELANVQKAMAEGKTSVDMKGVSAKIEELQDKYEDLLADGKKEEARAVRRQVEVQRDVLAQARADNMGAAAKREAVETLKYDASLARIEGLYPSLNPDHDEFDEGTTEEVGVLLESLAAKGFSREVALEKAVKYVLGAPAAKDDSPGLRDKRAAEARAKAADADKKQPSALAKAGVDSDKAGAKEKAVDVMKLNQKSFSKLDEDTIAKLRGDYV